MFLITVFQINMSLSSNNAFAAFHALCEAAYARVEELS